MNIYSQRELNFYESKREKALSMFKYLLDTTPERVQISCEKLNFSLDELTEELRTTDSETQHCKDKFNPTHREERNLTKIMSVISDLNTPERPPTNLLESGRKSMSPRQLTRLRLMEISAEKEKKKHEKSLQMLMNIQKLKKDHDKYCREKLQKIEEKGEKACIEKNKIKRELEKNSENAKQRRINIYDKKKALDFEFSQKLRDKEKKLESKMNKIINKIKTPSKISDKKKIVRENTDNADTILNNIHVKTENSAALYNLHLKEKASAVKKHSETVSNRLANKLTKDNKERHEKLQWIIQKSNDINHRIMQKEKINLSVREKMRESNASSLFRHNRSSEVNHRNYLVILKDIENKHRTKEEMKNIMSKSMCLRLKEKIDKNTSKKLEQTARLTQIHEEFAKAKEQIIEKHKYLSEVADEIKNYKNNLSDRKRTNNLEIQRVRSAIYKSKSPSALNHMIH